MKKISSILMILCMITFVFVSCSAPSGTASTTLVSTDGGGSTSDTTQPEVTEPIVDPITISIDGTVATNMPLNRLLDFEWKVNQSSSVPSVVFDGSRAIYIKIEAKDPTHTSWGTWLYNETSKVLDARSAGTVFFQADDKGIWTGKLVMNSGEVLSPFAIVSTDSWTFK